MKMGFIENHSMSIGQGNIRLSMNLWKKMENSIILFKYFLLLQVLIDIESLEIVPIQAMDLSETLDHILSRMIVLDRK